MTRRSVLAAMLAVLGLLAAGSAGAADPVRIGYAIAKTGMFAPAAQSQINAYLLWADQVNQQGGLDVAGVKRPVEFVVYDDQSDFGKAPGIYEKLITNDKVDLLLAPWGTPFHFAIAGVLERYKFPMVGNSAASVALREVKPGNIWFPTSAIPDKIADELVKLLQVQKVKTVAINMLQLPFSQEIKRFLVPALEKTDIKIVVNEEYAPGVKDMTATLTKIKQAAPDAVLSLSYPPDSILYMKQAREIGIVAPFQLVLIGPTADFFGKMFGVNLDGIVTVGHWSPAQKAWPKARPFFDAYKAKFGEAPDYLDSALAYMSCEILQQAVAKAGLDKDKLRQAIATGTFDTIDGPVKFDGVQNAVTPTMLLQFQKGEAQIIWPPDQATAPFAAKARWSQN
jgi:branched-chain amino acid transport system substrate-binding protein